jgi:hypothetical protein
MVHFTNVFTLDI